MRYHVVIKILAVFIAVVSLTVAVVSGFGLILMAEEGLYRSNVGQLQTELYTQRAEHLARYVLNRYVAKTLSNAPELVLKGYSAGAADAEYSQWCDVLKDGWDYAIYDGKGDLVEKRQGVSIKAFVTHTAMDTGSYLVETTADDDFDLTYTTANGYENYYKWMESPTYTVTVSIAENAVLVNGLSMLRIETLIAWRYTVIWVLVASLLVFALCMIYLFCAAGKSHKSTIPNPRGFNRLPLDIYAVGVFFIGFAAAWIVLEGLELFYRDTLDWQILVVTGLLLMIVGLTVIGWLTALAAQVKMKQYYWWRNSLVGRCVGFVFRCIRFVLRGIKKIFDMLPLVWRRVLIIGGVGFGLLLAIICIAGPADFLGLLLLLATLFCAMALFGYDIYSFGRLMKGAQAMAAGKLEEKISTKYLFGSYKEHADHLNAMADVATVAAKQQMKSERMKAELITNVSHDIKTPLTSIINYVDLLQKPHTPEEETQYLEVLERQGQRMKRLLEDLMDMSKASTGNVTVEITKLDVVEAINQALGEFADKLTLAKVTPLFRSVESPIWIFADGKLTWRVLSNLLGNVVKYAQPETRLYLDLYQEGSRVKLSLKNISREELNVSADELTERFVRGDVARNTDGSGLGLNIAKSLMELQKGSLELLVDGDLFKVILSFPVG